MEHSEKKRLFRMGDAIACLLVVLLAAALLGVFFASKKGNAAEILVEGEKVAVLSLSKDAVYPIASCGYHLTVCVEAGEVFVSDTDCPDLVCLHTGKISTKGASIVCAAARVSVRIVGGGEQDADYVAG